MKKIFRLLSITVTLAVSSAGCVVGNEVPDRKSAHTKPNIILVFSDDISAREFPSYGSSKWSGRKGKSVRDTQFLAKTPVLDQLAEDGVQINTAWAATICSPSRAMMMTGRFAHLHKWWHNGDYGKIDDGSKKGRSVNLYESSPTQIGHLAQQAGYATMWAGKTQMKDADLQKFGFDEGVFSAGTELERIGGLRTNPYTNFSVISKNMTPKERAVAKKERDMHGRKKKQMGIGEWQLPINTDTGEVVDTFVRTTWLFKPSIALMNHPSSPATYEWWPNTKESRKNYGINTYGPDVELDFIFDFMDRQHKKNTPFFIYHTSHLGHGMFDFLFPKSGNIWPGTPKIAWDGSKYTRMEVNITGSKGVYDTHGTVTEPGMKSHVEYLDYQMWLYLEKLKAMGIDKNTIIIFTSDNGTIKYGKGSEQKQRGTHVPLIIYAPGVEMKKRGKQDVLASIADILPTLVDITGAQLPKGYEINGESLWPFLTTDKKKHREWVYAYKRDLQLIRGEKVMKDGNDRWWNVETSPSDLDSFAPIKDWSAVSEAHRLERDRLNKVLPKFDLYDSAHGL